MTPIIKKLSVELTENQIIAIAEFWEEYGTPGGALVFAQPAWVEGTGVMKLAVISPTTAEAIKRELDGIDMTP